MGDQRRVLVPQALGSDEFLRITWHEGRRLMVFSHWDGDHCVAATPVRIDQLGELAQLTVAALAQSIEPAAWAPPHPGNIVARGLAALAERSA